MGALYYSPLARAMVCADAKACERRYNGLVRWLSLIIRTLLVPWHQLRVASDRFGQRLSPLRYQIEGSCQHCGQCCRHLLFAEYPFLTWPVFRSVVRFWLERIYPFTITDTALMEPASGEYYRVMTCRNVVDNRCAEYWLRPRVCREWPLPELERPPILWSGCGHQVVDLRQPERGDVSQRRAAGDDRVVQEMARRFREQ